MLEAISSYSMEERILHGRAAWVVIRARGAEWYWLTPAETAHLDQQRAERFGSQHSRPTPTNDERALIATD